MCLSPVINLKKVHNGKRSDLILSFHFFFLYRCHSISHKLQQLQVCSRLKKSRRNGPLCGVFAGLWYRDMKSSFKALVSCVLEKTVAHYNIL